MPTRYSEQVAEGMDVYDAADEKVGTVEEVYDSAKSEMSSSGGGYLRVPTGFLGMGKEHHIPFSAIRDVRGDAIYLNIARERLDELGYAEAPIETDYEDDVRTVERPATATSKTPEPRRVAEDTANRKLQLREEELIARKRSVETGAVKLRTEVVSDQRTLDVPVTHEEVVIERHAVDRRPSQQPIGDKSETISVPVHEEQVTVDKKAVVYEEVSVDKRTVQETQHVSGTVRREEAVVEETGDVKIEGDANKKNPPRP
jgi:uncharacterized protein (TIGR02271 family)